MSITDIVLNEFTGNSGIFPTPVNQNFERLKDGILTRYDDVRSDLDEISTIANGSLPSTGGTMTGNLTISKSAPYIYLKNTAQEAGTIPSANLYERIYFKDKNGTTLGQVGNIYGTDGTRYSYITSAKGDGTENAQIRVGYDGNGKLYTFAPTPESGAHENTIATIGWVSGSVSSLISGGSKAGGNDRTVLFSTNVNSGDISLSEAFTSFNQLLVMGSADGGSSYIAYMLDTYWLNWMLTNTDGACIFTGGNHNYWFIRNYTGGTTTKKFVVDDENCRIRRIIGINRK